MSLQRNIKHNVDRTLRDLANVTLAHDAVHPDRDECGGVGGCLLMRAEVDAKYEVVETLKRLAREGWRVEVAPPERRQRGKGGQS